MPQLRKICTECYYVNKMVFNACSKCSSPLNPNKTHRFEDQEAIPEYLKQPEIPLAESPKSVPSSSVSPSKFQFANCGNPVCQSMVSQKEIYCRYCGEAVHGGLFHSDYQKISGLYLLFPGFIYHPDFTKGAVSFGRNSGNYSVLKNVNGVSREHCSLYQNNNDYFIIDMSSNGTWVNDVKLAKGKPHKLIDGSTIALLNHPHFKIEGKVVITNAR